MAVALTPAMIEGTAPRRRRLPRGLLPLVAASVLIVLSHCGSSGGGNGNGPPGMTGSGADAGKGGAPSTMDASFSGDTGTGNPPPGGGGDAQADAPIIAGGDAGGPPPSNRVDVNMGVTPWKFLISSDPTGAQATTFDDSTWADVGIPHTWNDADTFVNGESGGGTMVGGVNWYRKHFTLDSSYANRKILVEFEGVHIGAQVFVNGTFMPGNSA